MRQALPEIARVIAVMAGMVLAPLWAFCAFFLWAFADPISGDVTAALEFMVVSAVTLPLAVGEFPTRRLQVRVAMISVAGIEHAAIRFLPRFADLNGFLFGCLVVGATAAAVILAAVGSRPKIARRSLGKTIRG